MEIGACVGVLASWIFGFWTAAELPEMVAKPVVVVPTTVHARFVQSIAGHRVIVRSLVETPVSDGNYAMRNASMRGLVRADLLLVDQGQCEIEIRLWTERLANCGGPMVADFPAAALTHPRRDRSAESNRVARQAIAEALSVAFPQYRSQFHINAHVGVHVSQIVADDAAGNRDN